MPRRRAALAALLLVSGCATNPVTGRREFTLVTPAQEEQIGREGYAAVRAEYGVYEDSTLQRYVSGVGRRVARASQLPDLDWHFTVIDDPAVNAFAMPGGYIYVTRGILADLNSEAQLAGVLGHEIGHVNARHTARQITSQELAGLGLGIAGALSPSFARYGGVAQQALGLMFLKYSRAHETEADELGVQYATRAGYDAREMPATYHMLARVSERAGQRLPGFLSTHPDPGDREERTRELSRAAASGHADLAVSRSGYLDHMNGLVYGPDPRQGYFEGDRYFNPAIKLELTLPPGWTHRDSRAALVATLPGGSGGTRAAMQVSTVAAGSPTPGVYVGDLYRRGAIAGSDGGGESIGGHRAWVGRVAVTNSAGQTEWLPATWVRWTPELMLQILGETSANGDGNEARIFASARSVRDLTDPRRLEVKPDRVRVERAGSAGAFAVVVPKLGSQAVGLEETAIMNDLVADDPVAAGTPLKIVAPGRPR